MLAKLAYPHRHRYRSKKSDYRDYFWPTPCGTNCLSFSNKASSMRPVAVNIGHGMHLGTWLNRIAARAAVPNAAPSRKVLSERGKSITGRKTREILF